MIKVLFIRVPSDEMYDEVFTSLQDKVSEECLVEAGSFRNKGVAIRRVLGEALTVFALRKYFRMPFGSYRFARGGKGKPFVAEREDVFFNISHSGVYVVCAVSDGEIGVDIEKRSKARMEVAGRFFTCKKYGNWKLPLGLNKINCSTITGRLRRVSLNIPVRD